MPLILHNKVNTMNNKIRCVIAENNKEFNEIFSKLLNHEKELEVVGSAASGEALFELLEKTGVDVVLLDIEMDTPKAGIEYCKHITTTHKGVKVVMLTSNIEEAVILSAFECGAVDYILRESPLSHIIHVIVSAFNGTASIHGYAAQVIRRKIQLIGQFKENFFTMASIIANLTVSELEILTLLLKGYKQRQIAEERFVELPTVKAQVGSILKKFNLKRSKEVTELIRQHGLESFINKLCEK